MMRLSEAIRLGASLAPQAFGALADARGRTCAIGAALHAIGVINDRRFGWTSAMLRFPVLRLMEEREYARCPACRVVQKDRGLIAHLNDDHRWTREAIADFIETIELHQAGDAVARSDEVVAGGPRAGDPSHA
jgi:hypothetical protein